MKSQYNIAILIDSLAGGGAEKVMLTLADELVSKGHRVTFFTLKNKTDYPVPSTITLVFPLSTYRKKVRGWFNRKTLANLLAQSVATQEREHGRFDLMLVNLHESYRLAASCDFANCIYVIHNSYEQELQREKRMGPLKVAYMRSILKRLSGKKLVAVSKGVAHELSQATLFTPASVTCIYNPFDIQQIRQQSEQTPHADVPETYILHVGRAAKAKRHDVLFAALRSIRHDVKLVCLSGNIKKLKALAARHGVSDRVILPGFTHNPYAWMKHAKALVLSSDFEGLPTVLIESIICGTPVVSTNCPHGPKEIMQGPLADYLVPVRSPEALAQQVNQALTASIDLTHHPIVEAVGAEQIAQDYLSLIE